MNRHAWRSATLGLVMMFALLAVLGVRYTDVALPHSGGLLAEDVPRGADGFPLAPRPNVVLIVADDLDEKLMPWMPNTERLIAQQGASFSRYYVEQSTCCTSRSTILTGQYTHNHGVRGNHYPAGGFLRFRDGQESVALPTWLADNDYRSAMLGKYLNEYPFPGGYNGDAAEKDAMKRYVPPGWQAWVSPVDGEPYRQRETILNINGVVDTEPRVQYLDQLLSDRMLAMVRGGDGMDLREGGRFIYYSSYSPHAPYAAPARFRDDFTEVEYPRAPNFDEADVSDKYGLAAVRSRLSALKVQKIDAAFRDRIRSVQVLDETVARLVRTLRRQGTLENTYIIFTSDNGYNMGEHRLDIAKYNQFEETVRVPLLIRGPGIEPGTDISTLTGNVDLAPTIADMSGTPIPDWVDGLSLLPLLTGEQTSLPRDSLLLSRGLIPLEKQALSGIEEFPETQVESARHARLSDFNALVTKRWKLVQYTNSRHEELYDLRADPYEMTNLLVGGWQSLRTMSPTEREVVRDLRRTLLRLVKCQARSCLL
ncbi:sulfatase [Nocardioides sp.]|uniref:sulfatase family protein n=1 Tax=Nocardioides sp. TaxID=35761 RepID=UPI00356230F5